MSDKSERELQAYLNRNGYHTKRAPSSGTGIQNEDGERAFNEDVLALTVVNGHELIGYAIEDKHVKEPNAYIDAETVEGLKELHTEFKLYAMVAVSWKHKQENHEVFRITELDETDTRYVARRGQGTPLEDAV